MNMLTSRDFLIGLAVGVALMYFLKRGVPMPKKGNGGSQ